MCKRKKHGDMQIEFRDFKISDAKSVFEIIRDCYENIEIGGHTLNGIIMQIEGNEPEKLIQRANSIKYIIALSQDQIVGVGGYDDNKIHTLFVSRKLHGSGIGSKILDEILKRAKKDRVKNLITWSTIYAETFYKKNGFDFVREIYIPEDKRDIKLIEMKKVL